MKVLTFAYYVCLLKIFLLRSLSFSSLYLEKFFWDFATLGVFILKIMPFQEFFSSRFAISGVFLFRIVTSGVCIFRILPFLEFVNLKFCLTRVVSYGYLLT